MKKKTDYLSEMLDDERERRADSSTHETYDPVVAALLDLVYSRLSFIMSILSILIGVVIVKLFSL